VKTRVPLAWQQLMREKRRFLAASAGIAFSVVLMLTQYGFRDALLLSAPLLPAHLAGDLVLISPQYQYVVSPKTFTERRLYQALGCDGVASVESVYLGVAPFKNPFDRSERDIFVIGFNPHVASLEAPGVTENLEKIRTPGVALFDSIRRPEFGPVAEAVLRDGRVVTEVSGREVEIVGVFQLGTSFAADGNLVTSDETFLRIFPYRTRGIIDVGLVKLKRGADLERVKADLIHALPADVRVLTHDQFAELEMAYWTTNTPVGYVFRLGVLLGMFVGCIIVYQILYSDVTDHLSEYATLKAMGYRDSFLFKVVLQQSLVLSAFGFFPGILISYIVYDVSRRATLLPLEMNFERSITVYVLTIVMCTISGALAMRRLKAADPAEIF
jgi:putative ABC transport system permease protein